MIFRQAILTNESVTKWVILFTGSQRAKLWPCQELRGGTAGWFDAQEGKKKWIVFQRPPSFLHFPLAQSSHLHYSEQFVSLQALALPKPAGGAEPWPNPSPPRVHREAAPPVKLLFTMHASLHTRKWEEQFSRTRCHEWMCFRTVKIKINYFLFDSILLNSFV